MFVLVTDAKGVDSLLASSMLPACNNRDHPQSEAHKAHECKAPCALLHGVQAAVQFVTQYIQQPMYALLAEEASSWKSKTMFFCQLQGRATHCASSRAVAAVHLPSTCACALLTGEASSGQIPRPSPEDHALDADR